MKKLAYWCLESVYWCAEGLKSSLASLVYFSCVVCQRFSTFFGLACFPLLKYLKGARQQFTCWKPQCYGNNHFSDKQTNVLFLVVLNKYLFRSAKNSRLSQLQCLVSVTECSQCYAVIIVARIEITISGSFAFLGAFRHIASFSMTCNKCLPLFSVVMKKLNFGQPIYWPKNL